MKSYFRVIIVSFVVLSCACATLSREECVQGSWYDLGLMDGRAGTTYKRLGNHQKACSEYGISLDHDEYKAGRTQGLDDYCQLDNAIEMGLKGHRYQSVCPSGVHRIFQRYNRAAYNVFENREALRKLDEELYKKEDWLLDTKLTDDKRSKIRKKIHHLDRKRQRLRDKIYSDERELDRLQRNQHNQVSPSFGI